MVIKVPKAVFEQITSIRDSGVTNMFDYHTVHRIAYEKQFNELVLWMKDHKPEYWDGIMKGFAPE